MSLGYKVDICLILLKSQALSQRDFVISHSYQCICEVQCGSIALLVIDAVYLLYFSCFRKYCNSIWLWFSFAFFQGLMASGAFAYGSFTFFWRGLHKVVLGPHVLH